MPLDKDNGALLALLGVGLATAFVKVVKAASKDGSMATRRHAFQHYYQGRKMDPVRREKANRALREAGFDGNGRFPSIGKAINAMWGALAPYGMEITTVTSADRFRADSGIAQLYVGWRDYDDPFVERTIHDSVLHVSWTLLEPDRYELIAYLS